MGADLKDQIAQISGYSHPHVLAISDSFINSDQGNQHGHITIVNKKPVKSLADFLKEKKTAKQSIEEKIILTYFT